MRLVHFALLLIIGIICRLLILDRPRRKKRPLTAHEFLMPDGTWVEVKR